MGTVLRILIAIAIVAVVVRFVYGAMRSYVQGARAEEAEKRRGPRLTLDVADIDVRYQCVTCGLEVLVSRVPEPEEDGQGVKLTPLRHCREEMELVGDPFSTGGGEPSG